LRFAGSVKGNSQMDWGAAAGFFSVVACWIGFWAMFQFRKKPPKETEIRREPASYWGLAVQSVGLGCVWLFPRPYFSSILPMPKDAEIAVSAVAFAIAIASVWLCGAASRTLGKQWTYGARVIEGRELITRGPYARVRNPIYPGLFGMIVATGLVAGRWWMAIIGAAIFLAGTAIRIRMEEKLLRETFGATFDDYAFRVPPFFPRVF
jgi:protein-S-isoprenylcysteine O-methyltransferase Ste14